MGCFISQNQEDTSVLAQGEAKKLKVVMVGLEGAGKTSLLYYLKNQSFAPTQPTIGLNVETVAFQKKNFLIFDVGGKVRSLWSHYFENLDVLIFVIDVSDKSKLPILQEELQSLNKKLEFQTVLMMIFLTKWDLAEQSSVDLFVQELNIQKILDQDLIVQQCSAKTGEGIWEGIGKLTNFLDNSIKK